MLSLVLIRHAATAFTAERRYQGHLDVPLNEVGIREATALGAALRGWLVGLASAQTYASDLQRAARTAELALGRPADRLDRRLRELSFGDFEGQTAPELEVRFGALYQRWLDQPGLVTPPNAEPLIAMQARLLEWLDELDANHQTVAFTHGGVIRVLLGLLDTGGKKAMASTCESVSITLSPDRRSLAAPPLWRPLSVL